MLYILSSVNIKYDGQFRCSNIWYEYNYNEQLMLKDIKC